MRSGTYYLLYGIISTLIWFLCVLSSFLAHSYKSSSKGTAASQFIWVVSIGCLLAAKTLAASHRDHGVSRRITSVKFYSIWQVYFRCTLVNYLWATIRFATVKKSDVRILIDPTSPIKNVRPDLRAALGGSLAMRLLLRALVSWVPSVSWVPTPRRTGDTDKKKQRSKFHIHIAKLVYLDTHNPADVTIDQQDGQ
jgi:hypothetical protein